MKKTLITHPNFSDLWEAIAKEQGMDFPQVRFENFPDQWPNLFINDIKESIEHQDVTYIGDFSRPEDMFINYAMMRGILDYYAGKLRVIMPYFPVGTMERISEKWEIATAKYFADVMSHLPEGRSGKTSIHTFDIHALVERFFFDSFKVNLEIHTAMWPLSKEQIEYNTVIAFPDEGAEKRFAKDFSKYEIIVLSKKRIGNQRMIDLKKGDPRGKDIYLVDDLIQSGGTLMQAADFLRSLWAQSVAAFATHGIFPWDSHIKLAKKLDMLFVTDSVPANIERAKNIKNMEVISLQEDFGKLIFQE